MKRALITILVSTGWLISSAFGQDAYTMKWLRSGCIGFDKFSRESELTNQENDDVIQLGVYLQGFLQSTDMHSYSSDGLIKEVPIEWTNSIAVAKSLLGYINEFEQKHQLRIPDDFAVKSFVSSWYRVKHPKASAAESFGYERIFVIAHFPKVYERIRKAEQDGADQPATAPESKSEGDKKPQLESKGRSQ